MTAIASDLIVPKMSDVKQTRPGLSNLEETNIKQSKCPWIDDTSNDFDINASAVCLLTLL